MNKIATMPIYGKKSFKTFKNLNSDDLETLHIAKETWALQNLYKWWPWVDLDLFYNNI